MIVTNEIDYEWDIDNQFVCAGFPDRNKKSLQQMEPGDKIIYYVTKKKYGKEFADKSLEEMWSHDIYMHDFDTSTFIPYCFAYDLNIRLAVSICSLEYGR